MKRPTQSYLYAILILLLSSASLAYAGRIAPVHLFVTSNGDAVNGDEIVQEPQASFTIFDYSSVLQKLHDQDPRVPPTVLGAVRIDPDQEPFDIPAAEVTIPLIAYTAPGTELELVRPNATGSAWATMGSTARVAQGGFEAVITAAESGIHALYNPDWDRYLVTSRGAGITPQIYRQSVDQDIWGLFLENSPSPDKTPLILVHGDNSYKEKQARWDHFLEWVDNNPEFDAKYEIWRFNHDTALLIGYDGQTGNAGELGDCILGQFGNQRSILILAHSRGGLVSRAYMGGYGDGNQGDRILGLVTLATPHHGSPGVVPEWGLETVKGKFRDTDLADILYGYSSDQVVDVSDIGTMGLAWDNFEGPEHGIDYLPFSLESRLGNDHVLSVMDANVPDPILQAGQSDPTIYLPDRSSGTLEEMNQDSRNFGKIIAYGGYDTDLGLGGQNPFNWLDFSLTDHTGLEMATHLMANMKSKNATGTNQSFFMANDGMVPLQSALFLKKDSATEPIYEVEDDIDLFLLTSHKIHLKDFSSRMNFRKAVLCPDYDHLHLVEAKGGLLADKTDYWDHVAASLDELAQLTTDEVVNFTPEVVEISDSLPSFSSLSSGSNCFIGTVFGE